MCFSLYLGIGCGGGGHKGTMRCKHYSNHQMRHTPSEPSANTPPPFPLQGAHVLHKGGGCAPCAGRCPPWGSNRAVTSQPRTGQSTSYGDVKSSYVGAGGRGRSGCAKGAPRSANRQGEEQQRHTERGSHTRRDKGEHSRQGGGAQQGRSGNQNSGNREPQEGMGERAHGRQRQQRGWPGQPAPSLPGARATPAQLASGGGCLPQPRWAVCATGAGAHQGQTSCEGDKDRWWTAGTTRGGTGHLGFTHTESQRGRLWTACGHRRVDSKNSQTTPATTSTSSIRQLWG